MSTKPLITKLCWHKDCRKPFETTNTYAKGCPEYQVARKKAAHELVRQQRLAVRLNGPPPRPAGPPVSELDKSLVESEIRTLVPGVCSPVVVYDPKSEEFQRLARLYDARDRGTFSGVVR